MNSINLIYSVIAAYFLDLLVGDPYWFPHPAKGMGRAVTYLEPRLRRIFKGQRFAGFLLVMIIVGGTYLIIWSIIHWAGRVNLWLQFGLSSFLIFTALSTKSLGREARKVYQALLKKNLLLARRRVRALVGGDTENLNEDFKKASGIDTNVTLPTNVSELLESLRIDTKHGDHNVALALRGSGIRMQYIPTILNHISTISPFYYIWGFEGTSWMSEEVNNSYSFAHETSPTMDLNDWTFVDSDDYLRK